MAPLKTVERALMILKTLICVLSVANIISSSPYACSRIVYALADRVGLPQKLLTAGGAAQPNDIMYKAFHNNIYKPGAIKHTL